MATKPKKNRLFWLQIWLTVLSVIIVTQFVIINKLDSNNLKKEIRKAKIELNKEQQQLKGRIQSLENILNNVKNTVDSISVTQTKNDSTLSKQIDLIAHNWFALLIIVIIVLFITNWLSFIKITKTSQSEGDVDESNPFLRKLKKFIVSIFWQSSTLKEHFDKRYEIKKEKANNENNSTSSSNNENTNPDEPQTSTDTDNNKEKSVKAPQTVNENIKFFRLPQNNIFSEKEEVENQSDADFKVFNIKENKAYYEYCSSGAINSDLLKGICTFENSPNAGDKIETTILGEVKKDSNNNWVVTTPAKIKFL